MRKVGSFALIVAASSLGATPAEAAVAKLPIAEGVWVKTDTPCKSAGITHVYAGGRYGDVYFYGPNHSMGPSNETEALTHTSAGKNGFTVVNDGPIEVAAGPKGQAVIRAYSLSQGEQWREIVRICPAASLSAKMRSALSALKLLPSQ
jgi:hypothetical protein